MAGGSSSAGAGRPPVGTKLLAIDRCQTHPRRGQKPARFATNNDLKILAIPGTAWINKPAEKNDTKAAAQRALASFTLTNSDAQELTAECAPTNLHTLDTQRCQ